MAAVAVAMNQDGIRSVVWASALTDGDLLVDLGRPGGGCTQCFVDVLAAQVTHVFLGEDPFTDLVAPVSVGATRVRRWLSLAEPIELAPPHWLSDWLLGAEGLPMLLCSVSNGAALDGAAVVAETLAQCRCVGQCERHSCSDGFPR